MIKFSLPLINILVDKKTLRQIFDQKPIILPPNKTILFGNIKVGRKIIQIVTIPK